jgi:hypothetical protein
MTVKIYEIQFVTFGWNSLPFFSCCTKCFIRASMDVYPFCFHAIICNITITDYTLSSMALSKYITHYNTCFEIEDHCFSEGKVYNCKVLVPFCTMYIKGKQINIQDNVVW